MLDRLRAAVAAGFQTPPENMPGMLGGVWMSVGRLAQLSKPHTIRCADCTHHPTKTRSSSEECSPALSSCRRARLHSFGGERVNFDRFD